jgi:ureidoglycolate hydrolase
MADRAARRLLAQPLTAEGFAPFGVLPPDEGGPGPTADLEFTLADGWVNFIGHAASEVEHGPTGPRCDHLNRHDTHTQTLMPMDGDALLVVAPPAATFADPADLDLVAAFVLPRYQPVHLHRGTWHWGPYPVAAESVRLLNIQGQGWPDDNTVASLPRVLEISAPPR